MLIINTTMDIDNISVHMVKIRIGTLLKLEIHCRGLGFIEDVQLLLIYVYVYYIMYHDVV